MNKRQLISFVRSLGGAPLLDRFHYLMMRFLKRQKNREFTKKYRHIPLPPPYLVYESFQMDYEKYYLGGRQTAEWIARLAQPHISRGQLHILDWGCGPARVIRHLPDIMGASHQYFGCDYNPTTIEWCKKHITNVKFHLNGLLPPLPYENMSFDLVYGISIFTHLSKENHTRWMQELHRVLNKGGILILTTHGGAFKQKMTPEEQKLFDSGTLVIRSKAKEGQRMYGAFHPPTFMRNLYLQSGLDIINHIPGTDRQSYIEQDTWILRKISKPAPDIY